MQEKKLLSEQFRSRIEIETVLVDDTRFIERGARRKKARALDTCDPKMSRNDYTRHLVIVFCNTIAGCIGSVEYETRRDNRLHVPRNLSFLFLLLLVASTLSPWPVIKFNLALHCE